MYLAQHSNIHMHLIQPFYHPHCPHLTLAALQTLSVFLQRFKKLKEKCIIAHLLCIMFNIRDAANNHFLSSHKIVKHHT